MPTAKVDQVAWDDLEEVFVLTTAEGPNTLDVFFVLVGREESVLKAEASSPVAVGLARRLLDMLANIDI